MTMRMITARRITMRIVTTKPTRMTTTTDSSSVLLPFKPSQARGEALPGVSAAHLPALMRLLQLASPALPVGGYSYSQALEAAVDRGQVHDALSANRWISNVLHRFVARSEAPVVLLAGTYLRQDGSTLAALSQCYLASRESAAARDETRQMGWSLLNLARHCDWLESADAAVLESIAEPVFPVAFGVCGAALGLSGQMTLSGYLFSWLENQVIALQKLLALGQSVGQAMLFDLAASIPRICAEAAQRADNGLDAIETLAPHLGLLAARHESQYSRIFRT
jgi:urease accessory protein